MVERVTDSVLRHADWDNLEFYTNCGERLSGATMTDWAFYEDLSFNSVKEILVQLFKDRADTYQHACPDDMHVSTPVDKLVAGFNETGQLTNLLGNTHYLPVFVEGGEYEQSPVRPADGGFGGIRQDGDVSWLWDEFDTTSAAIEDYGVAEFEFENDAFNVEMTGYVPFESETLRLDYRVKNVSGEPQDGSFVQYLRVNANDRVQQWPIFHSEVNTTETARQDDGERVQWRSEESDASLHAAFPGADRSGVVRAPIDDADRESARSWIDEQPWKDRYWMRTHEWLVGYLNDAPVFEPEPYDFDEGTPFNDIFDEADKSVVGRYISAVLEKDFSLNPGEQETCTVTISEQTDGLIPETAPDIAHDAAVEQWQDWMADIDAPQEYEAFCRQQVANIFTNRDPETGAIRAAPTLQPAYSAIWPRDMMEANRALAQYGFISEAVDGLETLTGLMEDDGSFKQCYWPDGRDAHFIPYQVDQSAMYIDHVEELDALSEHDIRGQIGTDPIERAAAFIESKVAENDLIAGGYGYQENPAEINQDIWKTGWAITALETAVTEFGLPETDATDTLKYGLENHFLNPDDDTWYTERKHDGRHRTYNGMNAAMYRKELTDDPAYLEDIVEQVGVDTVDGHWYVGLNTMAEALFHLDDTELEIDTEGYSGIYSARELGEQRVTANIDTLTYGTLPERKNDQGRTLDAVNLSWAAASALNAINAKSQYHQEGAYISQKHD